jgi:hypothetical protein
LIRADEHLGLLPAGLGREDAELVAALADDGVGLAHDGAQRRGDLAEQLVAGEVPRTSLTVLKLSRSSTRTESGRPVRRWRSSS